MSDCSPSSGTDCGSGPSFGGGGFGPGDPGWSHHDTSSPHYPHHRGGRLPTTPLGVAGFIIAAIIFLIVSPNISHDAEQVDPATSTSQVLETGEDASFGIDPGQVRPQDDFDIPAVP